MIGIVFKGTTMFLQQQVMFIPFRSILYVQCLHSFFYCAMFSNQVHYFNTIPQILICLQESRLFKWSYIHRQ